MFARERDLAILAAREAGAIVRHWYERPITVTEKGPDHPLTRADLEANNCIRGHVSRAFPDDGWLSEETADSSERLSKRRVWVVDPLDGTKEFIQKRSDFTVNIALIVDGRPRFGLVYAPARSLLAVTVAEDEAVEAELAPNESGARLDSLACRPLRVRVPAPEGFVAVVSHSHLDADTESFLAKLKIVRRSSAGSSLKFLLVARGEADVYPRFGPTMEWDIAAGQAVLEAAGGTVVTADGKPFRYGKVETGLRNPSFIAWGRRD
jgi:3'(2'), 5'-bisphosphate nucleotidase